MTYLSAFSIAFGSIKLEQRFRGITKRVYNIEDAPCGSWPRLRPTWPTPSTRRLPPRISELTQLSGLFAYSPSLASVEVSESATTHQQVDTFIRTLPIWICSFLLLTIGIPVYFATGFDIPFEAIYFVLVWTCCLQLLRSLKTSRGLLRFPGVLSILVILANPVLVTSGFGTVYFWIKTTLTNMTIDQVVTNFRKHETLAEAVTHVTEYHDISRHIGAGDLACGILDAGILCLGMKMFEYRRELGACVCSVMSTCLVIAVTNVFLNVVLAREMGLETEEALAFAAKSVTIALGVPAVQKVNGSTALMSALCIFSGMLFQMSGNYIFKVLGIDDTRHQEQSRNGSGSDTEKPTPWDSRRESNIYSSEEETKLLAAGVTVGINAAAMGTAHLIERGSTVTAYSALSMTIYGGITVALTALPGVSDLLIYLSSR